MGDVDEKQLIIASMIGLTHSFGAADANETARAFANRIKKVISLVADPKYQGVELYSHIIPIRRDIAYAISLYHFEMNDQQTEDWREFVKATDHAYNDYWKGISILRTLP